MTRVVAARREAPGDHRHGSGKLQNRDVIDFDKMANTTFINLLKFVRQQRERGALIIECDDDIYNDDDIQEIVTWCECSNGRLGLPVGALTVDRCCEQTFCSQKCTGCGR